MEIDIKILINLKPMFILERGGTFKTNVNKRETEPLRDIFAQI